MRYFTVISMALVLALTACMEAPQPREPQAISFKQYSPIVLDVADVSVTSLYRSPLNPPNVEHLFPTTPADAVKIWVSDRVRTMGASRKLEVTIRDARVVETPLTRTKGIKGAFTNDQAKRYDARLEIEMRIYGDSPLSLASLNVAATRSDTLPENASPADRDALFARMLNDLMAFTNAELEKNFYKYFNNYITS